jgi:hypothetical protein
VKLIEAADSLAMAVERAWFNIDTLDTHLGNCRPWAGALSSCEAGCPIEELRASLSAYMTLRSERPHGWRGYFARGLAEALARVSKLVGQ